MDGRRIQAEEPDSGSDIGSHGHMSRRSSVYHGSPHGVTLTNKSLSSIATTPVKHTILVVQPDGWVYLLELFSFFLIDYDLR